MDGQHLTDGETFMEYEKQEVLTPLLQKLAISMIFNLQTVLDRNGRVISASDPERLNDNLSGREIFEALLGRSVFQDILLRLELVYEL